MSMPRSTGKIRWLPVLIVLVFLAFSVRVSEVANGISTLIATAQAESAADADNVMDEDFSDSDLSYDPDREGSVEGQGLIVDDERPPEPVAEVEPEEEEPSMEWRAAGDEDLEYEAARMKLMEDLSERREELNKRERNLQAREALLRAAEQELERKYAEMSQLRQRIEKLLDQQSEQEKERINSLVKVYEGMKAKQAAAIFNTLDLDVLISVASRMSERKLSPVLAAMNPERARTVTIMLAEERQLPSLPAAN